MSVPTILLSTEVPVQAISPATPVVYLLGMDHFLYGLSDEMKQAYREQLFAVSHDKLTSVSHK